MKKILITGCAGFIGFHLSKELTKNYKIIGIDSFEKKVFSKIAKDRIKNLKKNKNFKFKKINISKLNQIKNLFLINNFYAVINLAATPGVRDSFKNPEIYFNNNILGFYNIYLMSIKYKTKIFLFGSSSSVYGNNKNFNTDNPISFYAATKKCNEIISHSFLQSSITKIIGLRFFTVYGPWGRPDMAVYKFSNKINKKQIINIFNHGNHGRDFSYIDDVVKSIVLLIKNFKKLKKYQILDIGKGKTENLKNMILLIEKNLDKKKKSRNISMQLGDVEITKANIKPLKKIIKYFPQTSLKVGIKKFIEWFKTYHKK